MSETVPPKTLIEIFAPVLSIHMRMFPADLTEEYLRDLVRANLDRITEIVG